MDFNKKKPLHIFAFLLLILTFIIIIGLPVLSFIGVFPSTQDTVITEISFQMEIMIFIFQLVIIFFTLVLIPILWYIIVNECSMKEVFSRLKLKLEGIDTAFLWGIVAAILIFISFIAIELILISLGVSPEELGNIEDLEVYFSPVTLFLIVAIQPIAEEIFFRGFLLEKIQSFAGNNIAIFSTAILFGLAHGSYQSQYPVIFPMIMGIFLGYIVIKTKNLYSAITTHVLFNIGAFILYYFAKALV